MGAERSKQEARERFGLRGWQVTLLAVLVIVGIATAAVIFRGRILDFKAYGYLGLFFITMMASAVIIVPIPGTPAIFVFGGIMNNLLSVVFVGLVAGLGEAIGEFTGYFAGRGGHAAFKGKYERLYNRVEGWMKKRGGLTIFAASTTLNPIFDMFGVIAGAMHFAVWKFFLFCWAGKTVKGMWLAFLGYFGLGFLLRWLGISV